MQTLFVGSDSGLKFEAVTQELQEEVTYCEFWLTFFVTSLIYPYISYPIMTWKVLRILKLMKSSEFRIIEELGPGSRSSTICTFDN